MRRSQPLVFVVALLAALPAACAESPTAVDSDAQRAAEISAQKMVTQLVPYRAVFDDLSSYVAPGPECPVLTVYISGTGRSSHLGRTTVVQHHCINPFGPDPLAFDGGYFEATGANGDAVFGTYAGRSIPTANPIELGWTGTWEFTGGTGRFEAASGQGDGSGVNNLATGGGISELNGWISTVGR